MVAMRDSSKAALAVGRFAGWEPLGFEAGDENWYRFVANGPTGKTDPSGLITDEQLACRADACDKQRKDQAKNRDNHFLQRLTDLGHKMLECCNALPAQQRAACRNEVERYKAGLTKAYKEIYRKGGPQTFCYFGPVCSDCEETVLNNMPPAPDFFLYSTHYSMGSLTHHVWGDIRCKTTGAVFTIDFWKQGSTVWQEGKSPACDCCKISR